MERIRVNPDQTGKQSACPPSPTAADHALAVRAATEAGRAPPAPPGGPDGAGRHPMATSATTATARPTTSSSTCCPRGAPATRCSPRRAATTSAGSSAERVWIVDPLDGTREFGERGPHRLGRARRPRHRRRRRGRRRRPPRRGHHARHRPRPRRRARPATARPRIVVTRSRPPHQARLIRRPLGGELRAARLGRRQGHGGGAGRGRRLRPRRRAVRVGLRGARRGGAARPACTSPGSTAARSATTSRDPWLPDLLICRAELAEPVLAGGQRLTPRLRASALARLGRVAARAQMPPRSKRGSTCGRPNR